MRFLFLKPIVTKLMANYKKYNNNSTYLPINFLFYYFAMIKNSSVKNLTVESIFTTWHKCLLPLDN